MNSCSDSEPLPSVSAASNSASGTPTFLACFLVSSPLAFFRVAFLNAMSHEFICLAPDTVPLGGGGFISGAPYFSRSARSSSWGRSS